MLMVRLHLRSISHIARGKETGGSMTSGNEAYQTDLSGRAVQPDPEDERVQIWVSKGTHDLFRQLKLKRITMIDWAEISVKLSIYAVKHLIKDDLIRIRDAKDLSEIAEIITKTSQSKDSI